MRTTNVAEAKAQSKLNGKPLTGKEAATYGEPTAKAQHGRDTRPRQMGVRIWRGEVYLADDFDELPAELLKAFTTDDAP